MPAGMRHPPIGDGQAIPDQNADATAFVWLTVVYRRDTVVGGM